MSSYVPRPNKYYEFKWTGNRNFCVTAKHCCDFECSEAEEDVGGEFHKFALKTEGEWADWGTFEVVGYYKTKQNALKALHKYPDGNTYLFVWNRDGKCVDGC